MSVNVLVKTEGMEKDEWLQWRRKGIGGSHAAAILGLNPYMSAFDVYAEIKGLAPEQPDNEAMRQGRDLEDYVASRFTEATGKSVRKRNAILQHPEHPWLIGNIDRVVVGEDAGVECKTTSVLNKSRFAQGKFPPIYYVQCVHYMALTGADRWYLAVLVLNKGFHVFTIERDESEIEALIEAEKAFWENHVLANIPPTPDGTESTSEVIKAMFPAARDREEIALFGHEDKMRLYLDLKALADDYGKQAEAIKQEIQLEMKDAEIGRAAGYIVTWKNQTRQTLDTKRLQAEKPDLYKQYLKPAKTVRVFDIKEAEE